MQTKCDFTEWMWTFWICYLFEAKITIHLFFQLGSFKIWVSKYLNFMCKNQKLWDFLKRFKKMFVCNAKHLWLVLWQVRMDSMNGIRNMASIVCISHNFLQKNESFLVSRTIWSIFLISSCLILVSLTGRYICKGRQSCNRRRQ